MLSSAHGYHGGFSAPHRAGLPARRAMPVAAAPRWIPGKSTGDATTSLKLKDCFAPDIVAALTKAGNEVAMIPPCCDMAGHAGGVALHSGGLIGVAADARADGGQTWTR